MTVAVAGGSLGVVNSGRAERSTSILSDRYLVLQPPVRDLRAGVSSFQVVAERAFSGTGVGRRLARGRRPGLDGYRSSRHHPPTVAQLARQR